MRKSETAAGTAVNRDEGPVNVLQDFLGYQLRRASNAMIADLSQRLMPLDLTPSLGTVLLMIKGNSGITQIRLARALAIKRANLAPLIASLEKRGIVERLPVDGRSQGLVLTENGQVLTDEAIQIMTAHERRFKALLSKSTLQKLLRELPLIWNAGRENDQD